MHHPLLLALNPVNDPVTPNPHPSRLRSVDTTATVILSIAYVGYWLLTAYFVYLAAIWALVACDSATSRCMSTPAAMTAIWTMEILWFVTVLIACSYAGELVRRRHIAFWVPLTAAAIQTITVPLLLAILDRS